MFDCLFPETYQHLISFRQLYFEKYQKSLEGFWIPLGPPFEKKKGNKSCLNELICKSFRKHKIKH